MDAEGKWEGTFPIFSWKWNYKYLLISKQYPHLYTFYWVIMGPWCVIIQLSIIKNNVLFIIIYNNKYYNIYLLFNILYFTLYTFCFIIQLSIIQHYATILESSLNSLLQLQFSTYKHWTKFIVKRKQVRIEAYSCTPIQS